MDQDPQPGPSSSKDQDGAAGGQEAPASLAEILALPENQGASLVVPLAWCPHLESASPGADRLALPGSGVTTTTACADCGNVGENWVCLHCLEVRCSRYVNEHSLMHAVATDGHRMCLSFSDLSVWCYGCESYVDNDRALYQVKNKFHLERFGTAMPRRAEGQSAEEGLEITLA